MPTSRVAVIDPVSCATKPRNMAVTVQYDHPQPVPAFLYVYCKHDPTAATVFMKNIPANSNGPLFETITLPHTTNFTGVEIEARLLTTNDWNGPYFASGCVDDVTISGSFSTSLLTLPEVYYKPFTHTGFWVPADKRHAKNPYLREYDATVDLVLDGVVDVKAYTKPTVYLCVYGGKKYPMKLVFAAAVVPSDEGKWSVTVPKTVLGDQPPRQAIASLVDGDEWKLTMSAALTRKDP